MTTGIEGSKISVIVQGPIRFSRSGVNLTHRCLENVRRLLPKSEIILSTWLNSDVSGIECDHVICSDDPGSLARPNHRDSNVNRQIVSTKNGLRHASKPYALKLRSDCEIFHLGFLDHHKLHENIQEYNIFSEPITASSIYFKNPHKTPYLFHISDVFHFGRTDDLLRLWDIPLVSSHYISSWKNYFNPPLVNFTSGSFFRYIEEQYIWIACLQKHGHKIDINYPWEMRPELVEMSEKSIFSNFTIVDNDDLGLCVPWDILFFGLNKIYDKETRTHLAQLYQANDPKEIKKRIRQVILTQYIRTPLKYFADILNRYSIF